MNAKQIESKIAVLEHMLDAMTSRAKLSDKAALRARIRELQAKL